MLIDCCLYVPVYEVADRRSVALGGDEMPFFGKETAMQFLDWFLSDTKLLESSKEAAPFQEQSIL